MSLLEVVLIVFLKCNGTCTLCKEGTFHRPATASRSNQQTVLPNNHGCQEPHHATVVCRQHQPQSLKEKHSTDGIKISISDQSNNFLIVHQTKWQRELLLKYGGEIAYWMQRKKTSRYALLLLLLWFSWKMQMPLMKPYSSLRTGTQPGTLMDFSEAEINAIERLFPSKHVNIYW